MLLNWEPDPIRAPRRYVSVRSNVSGRTFDLTAIRQVRAQAQVQVYDVYDQKKETEIS